MRKLLASALMLMSVCTTATAQAPISLADGVLDMTDKSALGLTKAPGTETITVFQPTETTDHYSNGVVLAAFKGTLYCMWQSDPQNEDYPETWVAMSKSTDNGATWSAPEVLDSLTAEQNAKEMYVSSGGWLVTEDSLIAYLNVQASESNLKKYGTRRYVAYRATADGEHWTESRPVLMEDGEPLYGIFEQDPRILPNGRIIGAAHFPTASNIAAKMLMPIYTDDATSTRGWKKADFKYTDKKSNSREMEPSWYMRGDSIVMVMRDQNSTYRKLVSVSLDNGETWSKAVETNIPDSRAKQSAGNLTDGTAFLASNPTDSKNRWPMALLLSDDGETFNKGWLLRSKDELPERKWTGKAKTLGFSYPKSIVYNNALWVAYSQNKEEVLITKVPLSSVSTGLTKVVNGESHFMKDQSAYNLAGQRVDDSYKGIVILNGKKFIRR